MLLPGSRDLWVVSQASTLAVASFRVLGMVMFILRPSQLPLFQRPIDDTTTPSRFKVDILLPLVFASLHIVTNTYFSQVVEFSEQNAENNHLI